MRIYDHSQSCVVIALTLLRVCNNWSPPLFAYTLRPAKRSLPAGRGRGHGGVYDARHDENLRCPIVSLSSQHHLPAANFLRVFQRRNFPSRIQLGLEVAPRPKVPVCQSFNFFEACANPARRFQGTRVKKLPTKFQPRRLPISLSLARPLALSYSCSIRLGEERDSRKGRKDRSGRSSKT